MWIECRDGHNVSRLVSGNPKGAMLTHRNVVSNVSAFICVTKVNTVSNDSHINQNFSLSSRKPISQQQQFQK